MDTSRYLTAGKHTLNHEARTRDGKTDPILLLIKLHCIVSNHCHIVIYDACFCTSTAHCTVFIVFLVITGQVSASVVPECFLISSKRNFITCASNIASRQVRIFSKFRSSIFDSFESEKQKKLFLKKMIDRF